MTIKIMVSLAGLLAIVLVNWYFFGSKRKPKLTETNNKSPKKLGDSHEA